MESGRQGTFESISEIRQRLEVARKALDRWARRLRGALERLELPETVRASAELLELRARTLLSHLPSIPKGSPSIRLPDYSGDGTGTIVLELDPSLPPRTCAERMLKEARKQRRNAEMIPVRKAAMERELEEIEDWKRRIEAAWNAGTETSDGQEDSDASDSRNDRVLDRRGRRALETILDALETRLLPRGLWPAPPRKREAEPERKPVRWPLKDGWILMAGRSGTENDILTTRIARPDDLWFHVANVPGAHVVLRSPDGRAATPPPELVERAASLAAWLSRLRAQANVEVRYTERKRVRKPRKAPAGTVVMEQSRSILVKPSPPPAS
jgi:predicted ribosome quality control (RQC) complex YloA/Tae2 family protein